MMLVGIKIHELNQRGNHVSSCNQNMANNNNSNKMHDSDEEENEVEEAHKK